MSDAMLSKVRKLLAKAEDPACTMAEAEAFTLQFVDSLRQLQTAASHDHLPRKV